MAERPVLFSVSMVRALLAGRKTVTRRLLKPQPAPNSPHDGGTKWVFDAHKGLHIPCGTVGHLTVAEKLGLRCPFGQPGDRLWVRETWRVSSEGNHYPSNEKSLYVEYRAGAVAGFGQQRSKFRVEEDAGLAARAWGKGRSYSWRPSIHMPRWASRLTLEVVSVRVERLHDITEEDAQAEGVERHPEACGWLNYEPSPAFEEVSYHVTARDSFASLWRSINGAESWDANPWVWRVEFRRVEVAEPEGEKVEPHRCEEECCLPK